MAAKFRHADAKGERADCAAWYLFRNGSVWNGERALAAPSRAGPIIAACIRMLGAQHLLSGESDPRLANWRCLSDERPALEFTDQGWALAEACAQLGEFPNPQEFIVFMLGQIIHALADDAATGPELPFHWQMSHDALSALVSFPFVALEGVAGVCEMTLGEFQHSIRSSVEDALLQIYRSDKTRLH